MAADTDPYFALPSLYGAPAYARPPRTAPDTERRLDPDDLPIAAEQTDEEREIAAQLGWAERTFGGGRWSPGGGHAANPGSDGARSEPAGRRRGLRKIAGLIGSRDR